MSTELCVSSSPFSNGDSLTRSALLPQSTNNENIVSVLASKQLGRLSITRMRGSAIHSVRSQWDRRNFAPLPPKFLDQFRCFFKYITTSPQGVDVQNLIKIDSAVAALRMREKTRLSRGFFFVYISVYRSIYLSVLHHAYRPHF